MDFGFAGDAETRGNMNKKYMSAPFDLSNIRYCNHHKMHWIPADDMNEEQASCPWCRLDLAKSLHDVAVNQRNGANFLLEEITKERDDARIKINKLISELDMACNERPQKGNI